MNGSEFRRLLDDVSESGRALAVNFLSGEDIPGAGEVVAVRGAHRDLFDQAVDLDDVQAVQRGEVVVDDLDAVAERLRSSGYKEGMSAMDHPHRRRIYFFDDDGNEYEFVEYLSTEASERNDYRL